MSEKDYKRKSSGELVTMDRAALVMLAQDHQVLIERLQAELAEVDKNRGEAWSAWNDVSAELAECKASWPSKFFKDGFDSRNAEVLALALRVKKLEEALNKCAMFKLQPHNIQQIVNSALSTTDKTADEVINSWLGEPVAEAHSGKLRWLIPDEEQPANTKLYAPRTEVKP